ncbi:MAG: 50S ribosomal protein L10 [Candidatus Pacebacteria bacterium]|nr:50S ribosomal protein L10 [Candidatus Paceibacterota bacterium]
MRPEKAQLVEDIGKLVEPTSHLFLINYKGLKVAEFNELRAGLADIGAECHVVPNRLLKIALAETEFAALSDGGITGDNAIVVGGDDPVAVAKLLRTFAKEHNPLSVKQGGLNGKVLQENDVSDLAELPSREVLLAQLLGVLQAPSRNVVGVLNQKVASICYVLQAYLDTKK